MPTALKRSLLIIDIAMILYWLISFCALMGWFELPKSMMYGGYGTPIIDAWNWSFAPLDILFSLIGLLSVRAAQRGDPQWRYLAIVSLTVTFCAGFMAVTFWMIRGEFDISWWIPNLILMAIPLFWVHRLIRTVT